MWQYPTQLEKRSLFCGKLESERKFRNGKQFTIGGQQEGRGAEMGRRTVMNIFSSKMELGKRISEQEKQMDDLKISITILENKVREYRENTVKLEKKINEYEKKYIETGIECDFCYTTLQDGFLHCPKCGRKIKREMRIRNEANSIDLFVAEDDVGGVLITQYNGFREKKVTVPGQIYGKKVIGIWNNVFEKCVDLEEVYFEEGCEYIGKSVFSNCSNLKTVRLPKSLLEIGNYSFSNCRSLLAIAVPPNVRCIGGGCFSGCSALKQCILPENLSVISHYMFAGTGLTKIDIPQSVKHIESSAFSDSKITELELPYNLYSIGSRAFACGIKKISMHAGIEIMNEEIFGKNKTVQILCAAGSKAHLYARKYGLPCIEIQAHQRTDHTICASGIALDMGSVSNTNSLAKLYQYIGVSKAESWAWESRNQFTLIINKTMTMEDAETLKRKIQMYINQHSDYSRPDVFGKMMDLSVMTYWGKSVV